MICRRKTKTKLGDPRPPPPGPPHQQLAHLGLAVARHTQALEGPLKLNATGRVRPAQFVANDGQMAGAPATHRGRNEGLSSSENERPDLKKPKLMEVGA